jgi:outer membrane murein-binding lipoprotein Lpp
MSENTPIETIKNKSKVNRKGEALGSIWTASDSSVSSVSHQGPFLFTGEKSRIAVHISEIIDSCKERLFISTQSFSDASLIQATENALQRGVRVYMILDSDGFDAVLKNPSCNALHGYVLLRERQERGLNLVLADWHLADRSGLLLTSPLDGTITSSSNGWAMDLSKNQIDEFSSHMQHEFWSTTEGREVLSPEEAKSPRPIAEVPFTLRAIQNQDHILRANFASDGDNSKAEAALRKEKNWQGQVLGNSSKSSILLHGEAIEVGTGAEQVIHSSPKSVEPATGLFAHSGLSLQLAVGAESYLAGWDRSATGDWHSILRLTAEQAKAAKALLQKFSKSPEWVGHSKIKLGDAGEKIIRDGKEMTISATQKENLGVIHLDKMPDSAATLHSHQPPMNPSETSLAQECTFEWISAPPVPPSSASQDSLHDDWKNVRKEIEKRLSVLNELNQPSKIPGFGRKAKELKKSVDNATKELKIVSDPKSLSSLVDKVEELTKSIGGNLDDIKVAEDEEARAKLEKEQREAHVIAVDKAKASIKDLETRLKKTSTELQKHTKAVKKAKDIEKERIESDISQLNPKIEQLGSELKKAREISTSKFEFKAPATLPSSKKGGGKTHKFLGDTRETKLQIKILKEGLPMFGTLFREGESRHLAISDWGHVEQGRKDAKRLKASLCATREVLG